MVDPAKTTSIKNQETGLSFRSGSVYILRSTATENLDLYFKKGQNHLISSEQY